MGNLRKQLFELLINHIVPSKMQLKMEDCFFIFTNLVKQNDNYILKTINLRKAILIIVSHEIMNHKINILDGKV